MPPRARRLVGLLVPILLPLAAATGCLDVLTGSSPPASVAILLTQQADATEPLDGERLDVTITGPGIETPIFGSFRFVNDTARAVLQVPQGRDRLVSVAVFDSSNALVASGETVVEIGGGARVRVEIEIAPTVGDQPITVTVGNTVLTVTPGSLALSAGDTVVLGVTVTDQAGVPLTGVVPTFASSNPAIASVSPIGAVAGRLQGVTAVTVSANGVAARVPVVVSVPSLRSP